VTDRPGANPNGAEDSRAEQVLSQALNVMAGGKAGTPGTGGSSDRRRLTTVQLVLLAALIGLLVGIGAGFLSLLF
jgi:hypothetical protein